MYRKFIPIIFLIILNCCSPSTPRTLDTEMNKINTDTTLIVTSDKITGDPLWSHDSQYIIANIANRWIQFNLKNIEVIEEKWNQKKIGVLINKNKKLVAELKNEDKGHFRPRINYDGNQLVTRNGIKFELLSSGLSTSLIKTTLNSRSIIWTSPIEQCYNLSISPNEKYVAYICDLSGLFVTQISK